MRRNGLVRWVLALVAVSGLAAVVRAADDKDVIGTWKVKFEPGDGVAHEADLAVTKDGANLKAVYTEGPLKVTAKDVGYNDGELRFTLAAPFEGAAASTTFVGKVKGDAVEGECKWTYQGMTGAFPFTAKRQPAKSGK